MIQDKKFVGSFRSRCCFFCIIISQNIRVANQTSSAPSQSLPEWVKLMLVEFVLNIDMLAPKITWSLRFATFMVILVQNTIEQVFEVAPLGLSHFWFLPFKGSFICPLIVLSRSGNRDTQNRKHERDGCRERLANCQKDPSTSVGDDYLAEHNTGILLFSIFRPEDSRILIFPRN